MNYTISATLDVVQFSCMNSILRIRDEAKENEIIFIKRSSDNIVRENVLPITELTTQTKQAAVTKSSTPLMRSDGQTLVLEYLAPRRSCRINIKINAFGNGKNVS